MAKAIIPARPLNITAALAVKEIMERDKMPGTLMLWPGVAEELLAGKAFLVRAGVFKDVDAVLFTHVGNNLQTSWGDSQRHRHAVGRVQPSMARPRTPRCAPWRGKSALDAVELMDMGWNMRREHLRPEQRSHYVITNGGDQPNVVPSEPRSGISSARPTSPTSPRISAIADKIADAAAMMTDTTMTRRVIGTAAPRHFSKPIAEAMQANINQVGLPKWTDDENTFRQSGAEAGRRQAGGSGDRAAAARDAARAGSKAARPMISATFRGRCRPSTLHYPANIPNVLDSPLVGGDGDGDADRAQGHHRRRQGDGDDDACDLLTRPELVTQAKDYFATVQQKNQKYVPGISATDMPQIQMNKETMDKFRPEQRKFYYDEAKYDTYLDQLGIKFPTITKP